MITMPHEGIDLARLMNGSRHSPVVYFLRIGGWVKIGTSTNLTARINTLSVTLAEVAKVVPGGVMVETEFHRIFAPYRIYPDREWFRDIGDLYEFLQASEDAPNQLSNGVTLKEALRDGLLVGSIDAVRKAAGREGFPEPVGQKGNAKTYDPTELTEWGKRRGKNVG